MLSLDTEVRLIAEINNLLHKNTIMVDIDFNTIV
ncbi:hypothetical protein K144313037_03000 [Clostridium tetani]|uniref:Uncharacterized protein n=1 Tax=Clostridium tetani TaxID=1513 RepID=A0ABC8EA77_CLOTA|nr:Uncharacterised protein [Clostridium tetani]BDR63368.1 hypothetical protein K134307016_03020 [Clostridium tetani]BDR66076.1 hypothetical protein K144312032_03040 [Clostridium tetani]BDR68888.1 hypothetical protein K144313037_03000 [Clostridium tetani]BDR74649.1 hypothetical protein K154306013_03090 [Clostridium tetani]